MPYYNMTALADNTTGLDTMIAATNSMTNGWFSIMLLVGLLVIFFLAYLQRTGDTNRSLAASGFICMVLSALMWALGWISVPWLVGFEVLAAGTLAMVFRSR